MEKDFSEELKLGGYSVIKCPVCGAKTLNNYYICPECDWEYDGTPEGEYSDVNHATLESYREKYKNGEAHGYSDI